MVFRSIPAEAFASFDEPGYVKIAWTLRADPIDAESAVFRTETRAVATDHDARRRFRMYWSLVSPGIWRSAGFRCGRCSTRLSTGGGGRPAPPRPRPLVPEPQHIRQHRRSHSEGGIGTDSAATTAESFLSAENPAGFTEPQSP